MSYRFIVENIFFALILTWQWIYMDSFIYHKLLQYPYIGGMIEALFVFLPYTCIREPFFPKTHFRDSMIEGNKTEKNQLFYKVLTQLTAVFYLFAKHFIGFALNYMRFINRIPDVALPSIHFMLIAASAATTIAMFLHTLKFKGWISGRVSFSLYVFSYLCTVYSWLSMFQIIYQTKIVLAIALLGLLLNRYNNTAFHVYQVILTGLFFGYRYGYYKIDV